MTDESLDCIYACNDGDAWTFDGNTTNDLPDNQKPYQLFIDADGYAWLAVITYTIVSGNPVPGYVWLYKSVAVLDCQDIKDGGSLGHTPEGPMSTQWWEFVCGGVAADGVDGCNGESRVDAENLSIVSTFYRKRNDCCLIADDECNTPPDDACGEIVTDPFPCIGCVTDPGEAPDDPVNLAPGSLLVELIADTPTVYICSGVTGSYELPYRGYSDGSCLSGCIYHNGEGADVDVTESPAGPPLGPLTFNKLVITVALDTITSASPSQSDLDIMVRLTYRSTTHGYWRSRTGRLTSLGTTCLLIEDQEITTWGSGEGSVSTPCTWSGFSEYCGLKARVTAQ